ASLVDRGTLNQALEFNGAGDRVAIASLSKAVSPPPVGFAVACWLRYQPEGEESVVFQIGDEADPALAVSVRANGNIRYRVPGVGSIEEAGGSSGAAWRHVAASFDGGRLALYVDGVESRTARLEVESSTGEWPAGGISWIGGVGSGAEADKGSFA